MICLWYISFPWYERVYLPLSRVKDTPFKPKGTTYEIEINIHGNQSEKLMQESQKNKHQEFQLYIKLF